MKISDAKEVAEMFQIPLSRVYELARLDVIPHIRIGQRQIRFDVEALEDWARVGGSSLKPNNDGKSEKEDRNE